MKESVSSFKQNFSSLTFFCIMKLDEMRDNSLAQKKRPTKKRKKTKKTKKQEQQQEQMLTIGVGFALILFAVFGFFKIRFFR